MLDSQDIYISETDFKKRYEYGPSDLLGEGGFAQVYKAFDKQFQQHVALKFYNKGEKGKYDVLHEMKDARDFSHKNIIRVHDAFLVRFEHTGTYNFVQVGVLEFANGGNLRDFVDTKPSELRFKEVLKGILEGIDYLHTEKSIIHRDLSPENILMFIEGDRWIPKIADFGISKKIDYSTISKDQKKSTQLLGKIDYMAPEQFYPDKFGVDGNITTQVDLWSFGIILFELFMKHTPFSADPDCNPIMAIQKITNDPFEDISEIPIPYRTIIEKCLVKEAGKRVQRAEDLISVLNNKDVTPVSEPAATVPIDLSESSSPMGRKWIWIVSALAAVVLSGFLIFKFINNQGNVYYKQLEAINLLLAEKDYSLARIYFSQLPEEIKDMPEFKKIKQKLDIWHLMQNKEYEKALGAFMVFPADDEDLIMFYRQSEALYVDSMKVLINANKISEAKRYYQALNEPHRSNPSITTVHNQLQQSIIIDSLIRDGNIKFERKNFSAAKISFNRVLEYEKNNTVARSKIQEIDNMTKKREPVVPVSDCIREIFGNSLRIKQKPDLKSSVRMMGICIAAREMRIKLEIQPSKSSFRIYGVGSPNAFYIEYNNNSSQLEVKQIKAWDHLGAGIKIDTEIITTKVFFVELVFDNLPRDVRVFNLRQGRRQLDEYQTYGNFIGIEI